MLVAVYADEQGQAFEDERFIALGRSGDRIVEINKAEFIPLPPGASLMVMPDRYPVGISQMTGNFAIISDRGHAVAALLPQGYTRTYLPAAIATDASAQLPLFGYTAVAWHTEENCFYVAAVPTDAQREKWNPCHYNTPDLAERVEHLVQRFPNNPIINQIAHCSLDYSCFTAQNMFYHRWEAGIPVSGQCNAQCVGCISEQVSECCPSPQQRITYTPTVDEVAAVILHHLQDAPDAIASFGQGCEGEPMLQASLIAAAIKMVRQQTPNGIINANTNAGYTAGIEQVCAAGIDSLRVSMNSAIPAHYQSYFRPRNYTLEDVKKSLAIARKYGVFVSLNWLTTPGVNDTEQELNALIELVREYQIDMIQIRNLNLDPDQYRLIYPPVLEEPELGILNMLNILDEELPGVLIGNFSRSTQEIADLL